MALPLDDVRVLDLTVARAGPTCVRQLTDWGADAIRIEPPVALDSGGASERHGSDFQNMHRNKRSVTIDLKSDAGRALFFRLVQTADVIVENMRPPVKHRLGVDYEAVRRVNPRVVYGSISGFGQDGPYGDRGGVDQIAQGMGGLMSITGAPGTGPSRVGIAITDLAAGMYMAIGVLAALHERDRTGEGQWVQTSLLEAMIGMLDFQATRWTVDGVVPEQEGNHHPTTAPMGTYPTADGEMNIAGYGGRIWKAFCDVIDRPELADDPRFASGASRSANRVELNQLIAQRTRTRPTAEWVERFNDAGVPAGPVNTIDAVFADPQVAHLGMVAAVEHAQLGELALIRHPVTMSRSSQEMRRATPERGEHTDEVLTELGLTSSEIANLRAAGVI